MRMHKTRHVHKSHLPSHRPRGLAIAAHEFAHEAGNDGLRCAKSCTVRSPGLKLGKDVSFETAWGAFLDETLHGCELRGVVANII